MTVPCTLRRTLLRAALAGAAAGVITLPAAAQTPSYPAKPITIVVPFTPGGTTDILDRKSVV